MKWKLLAASTVAPVLVGIFGGMSLPYIITAGLCGFAAYWMGVAAMGDPEA